MATGADDEEELSEKVVKMAMEILRLHCMWDIEQLLTAADDGEASSTLDAVVARCDACISSKVSRKFGTIIHAVVI